MLIESNETQTSQFSSKTKLLWTSFFFSNNNNNLIQKRFELWSDKMFSTFALYTINRTHAMNEKVAVDLCNPLKKKKTRLVKTWAQEKKEHASRGTL